MTHINLNAAGAAQPLQTVHDAILEHLQKEISIGPHWAALAATDRLIETRQAAVQVLGVPGASNIAFGETATRLWASALGAMPLCSGDRIIVARCEWGGNMLNALKRAKAMGATVVVAPSDRAGRIDVAALPALLDERTVAVCLPVVSSGLGTVQPIRHIGRLLRPDHCLLFADAAQAVGRMPVALDEWQADVVVAPARKWLRGPRGQAVMGLSRRALTVLGDPPLLDQAGSSWIRSDAWETKTEASRFESYEYAVANRLGFGAALLHTERNLPAIQKKTDQTLQILRKILSEIPGIRIFENDNDYAIFLTFICKDEAPAKTVSRLCHANIAIATVGLGYVRLEFEARGLREVCRVSPHVYTTEDDVAQFFDILTKG
jgi:cysteine desulfurase/selenocysteine lyase